MPKGELKPAREALEVWNKSRSFLDKPRAEGGTILEEVYADAFCVMESADSQDITFEELVPDVATRELLLKDASSFSALLDETTENLIGMGLDDDENEMIDSTIDLI